MEDLNSVMIANRFIGKYYEPDNVMQLYHQNTKHSAQYLMGNMYMSRQLLNSRNFVSSTRESKKSYLLSESVHLLPRQNSFLTRCLNLRRSRVQKPSSDIEISDQVVSELFWSGCGVNERGTRTSPSAGALYPCELYGVLFNDTSKYRRGLYHYSPLQNSLDIISEVDSVFSLSDYLLSPEEQIGRPSIIFFITALFKRSAFKYDARAYRYILLEAGAIAQNISLMATSHSLVSTSIGGTDDYSVERLLKLDGVNESLVNCVIISKDLDYVFSTNGR